LFQTMRDFAVLPLAQVPLFLPPGAHTAHTHTNVTSTRG
jgi:hypothetical protein